MNAPRLRLGLAGLLLFLGVAVSAHAADTFTSAYISEFLADNQHGLKDEEGDYSGWIELYNGGPDTVNLAGWFLTDTTTNLAKWSFPRVALLPSHYLVVFASGKARTNDLAHLHTNFRLNKQGGYLALLGRSTNIVSEFAPAYPKQSADVSYGRVRGEPAMHGHFQQPTPGKPNMMSGPGFAPEVAFSRPSSTFTAPFTLQLSSRSSNAVIRYTLDGNPPTSGSPVYAAPLFVTNTIQVRTRAYQEGLLPGPPHSEAYLLLHTNVLGFTSTLPVLIMETFGKDPPTSSRSSFVHLSFYEPIKGKTSLTNSPALATRGGFHIRGSSTGGMPQSSFAVQFLDEFNQEQHRAPLGLPADSDWVLYAPNGYEPVMIHNPFIHQLSRDMGRYSPRTRFLEVYLARNSGPVTSFHYNGIYVLEEKIKVGKHRVDIDRLGPDDLKPPDVTGGYLLKIDRLGPDEGGFSAGGASMVYIEPKEPVISLPQRGSQKRYLNTFFDDFERALDGANWKDPVMGYRAYIDVDAWIDYHVLEVLSGNVDIFSFSTYLHKPRNGKLAFGPHWDFDRALGSTDGRDSEPRQWNTGPFFSGAWWPRLFSDPDSWQQWVDRWQELRQTHFSLANIDRLIDRLTGELREAQPRQVERWNLQPRGGTYQSEIDLMKSWLSNRIDFIDHQLVPPPRLRSCEKIGIRENSPTQVVDYQRAHFQLLSVSPIFSQLLSREGGDAASGHVLAFTRTGSTNTTIYYTLDGSDPRLSQGAISSSAIRYTDPIQLNTNAQVVARARNPGQRQHGGPQSSTPWSGPVAARFMPTAPVR